MYEAMRLAATRLPPDVDAFLRAALTEETEPLAQTHLEVTLENVRLATIGEGLACGDTGYPLYFVTAGRHTQIEGGYGSLWEAARQATRRATGDNLLRPTMVDPLTRANPGTNIGRGMPAVHLAFADDDDGLGIVAVPKGGGSEIFGTFYRMLYPSDGEAGVVAFVMDCVREGCYAGKVCPPALIGVGIGGTADVCMESAKRAAVLRPLGTRNVDPPLAELESRLLDACRQLGLGPMGSRGTNAVLAVHVATAATHTAGLPVSVNAQCCVCRRWKASMGPDGAVSYTGVLDA